MEESWWVMFSLGGVELMHPYEFYVTEETQVGGEYASASKVMLDAYGWKYEDTSFVIPLMDDETRAAVNDMAKSGIAVEFEFIDNGETVIEDVLIDRVEELDRENGEHDEVKISIRFLKIHEGV